MLYKTLGLIALVSVQAAPLEHGLEHGLGHSVKATGYSGVNDYRCDKLKSDDSDVIIYTRTTTYTPPGGSPVTTVYPPRVTLADENGCKRAKKYLSDDTHPYWKSTGSVDDCCLASPA